MTREEKITFIIESIEQIEGAHVLPSRFSEYTDEEIDKKVKWYEYLWEK